MTTFRFIQQHRYQSQREVAHRGRIYRRDAVKNTHHARLTAQNTRKLWHCLEGLSIEPFDPDAAANWLNHYPGGLRFTE